MPQTGSHAQLDSSELLLCPSAGSACKARGATGWSLRVLVCPEHRATLIWVKGWWDGAEGGLCWGSVPGDTPQSITPSSCSRGDNSGIGDDSHRGAWCLCLLCNEEETFQSVARLSYETRICASRQAELPSTERQSRIATKGEVIHRLQMKMFKINPNGLVFL